MYHMDTKTMAVNYSSVNKPQQDIGREFLRRLNIKEGDTVLDMGCGTGELTRVMAEMVGTSGEVVGVEPIESRVKVAKANLSDLANVDIVLGDSLNWFPHKNDDYYDFHASNCVFHWVKIAERRGYLEEAHRCLKSGGRIAIQTLTRSDNPAIRISCSSGEVFPVGENEVRELLRVVGFREIKIKAVTYEVYHDSYESLCAWWRASHTFEMTELDEALLREHKRKMTESDQRVRYDFVGLQIIATK